MLNFSWFKQSWSQPRAYPPAPDGLTIFAVGDIHGRSDLLSALHQRIDEQSADIPLQQTLEVYLGDYVDRGSDSAGVIDMLVERSETRNVVFIRGNHEELLCDFLEDRITIDIWKALGGIETLRSYGVSLKDLSNESASRAALGRFRTLLPASHNMFFRSLRPCFQIGDYLFVHAGVKPGVALEQQSEKTMMWIRDEFLSYKGQFGYIIVHGHTPVAEPDLRPNRINIDTGAYATNKLTCLRIDETGPSVLE